MTEENKKGFFTKLKEKIFDEESEAEEKEEEELQEDIIEAEKVIEELEKKEQEEKEERKKEAHESKSTLQKVSKEEIEKESKNKPLIDVLKTIEDPELGIDIWTLGLIYNIKIDGAPEHGQQIYILMTFTSIMCPVGPMIVQSVEAGMKKLPNVKEVKVEVVFNPPWEPTEELREMLGV